MHVYVIPIFFLNILLCKKKKKIILIYIAGLNVFNRFDLFLTNMFPLVPRTTLMFSLLQYYTISTNTADLPLLQSKATPWLRICATLFARRLLIQTCQALIFI